MRDPPTEKPGKKMQNWHFRLGQLAGAYLQPADWATLPAKFLPMLAILVDSRTTIHRLAQVFNTYLEVNPENPNIRQAARQLLESNNPIPELAGLTAEEKAAVLYVVHRELDCMERAFSEGISYEQAFRDLYPEVPPYPSREIWFSQRILTAGSGTGSCVCGSGVAKACIYDYDDLMVLFQKGAPEVAPFRERFLLEIKLYQNYLAYMGKYWTVPQGN